MHSSKRGPRSFDHPDAEWSTQQNALIDARLQSANDLAAAGETGPVEFFERVDEHRSTPQYPTLKVAG